MLTGKRILLGVAGSIAAYKAVELLRRMQDLGADVRVTMTAHAAHMVTPLTFSALSGSPVLVDEFTAPDPHRIGHISITEGLDCAVIAPATGNVIGKVAAGIADDALTSAVMALDCPLVIAPAMNERMYRSAAVQHNMAVLKGRGVRFVDPEAGYLACGDEGYGRLASLEGIIQEIAAALMSSDLAGKTFLVTAGPTREMIDPVRFISNPSTGKMGYAIAAAARDRGARVILISGPVSLAAPAGVEWISVTTAAEMRRAVLDHAPQADVIIMAAAVSDFRPVKPSDRKIKKEIAPDTMLLERTEDILAELGRDGSGRVLVGFAAETEKVVEHASRKLRSKNLDLIVANDVLEKEAGFGSDTNHVTIIGRDGAFVELPVLSKAEVAKKILDQVAELIVKQGISP